MFDSDYSHFDCKYWLVFYLGVFHYFIIFTKSYNSAVFILAEVLFLPRNDSRGKAQKFPSYLTKSLLYNKGLLPISKKHTNCPFHFPSCAREKGCIKPSCL